MGLLSNNNNRLENAYNQYKTTNKRTIYSKINIYFIFHNLTYLIQKSSR
jgi:hypothetical protein